MSYLHSTLPDIVSKTTITGLFFLFWQYIFIIYNLQEIPNGPLILRKDHIDEYMYRRWISDSAIWGI